MRRILAAGVGAVLACANAPEPRTEARAHATGIPASDGCGSRFVEAIAFIRLSAPPSCPSAFTVDGVNLTSEPLFGASAPGRLAHYCLVRVSSASLPWPHLDNVGGAIPGAEKVDPSFMALTPQGVLTEATWAERRDAFRRSAGAVNYAGHVAPGKVPIVAMVDGAPDASDPGWTHDYAFSPDHGLTLARIAEEHLCLDGKPHGGNCWGRVDAFQALRYDQNLKPGRTHGSLGDLARSIYDAADSGNAPVINLSLAWSNPCMGGPHGDVASGENAAAGAVHEALQFARCRGAAIYAAAGNELGTPGSDHETGLMYPARWSETHSDPGQLDCIKEFGISDEAPTEAWPLVTPVGAVDGEHAELAIARPDGEPPLVAIGRNGVAQARFDTPSAPTLLLSGTSVPTMLVSAGNAVLQAELGVSPVEAEQMMHDLATPTTRWTPAGRGGEVHVFVLRRALKTLGLGFGAAPGNAPPSLPVKLESLPTQIAKNAVGCPGYITVWADTSGSPVDPCHPIGQASIDEAPLTDPQPAPVGCPGCDLRMLSVHSLELRLEPIAPAGMPRIEMLEIVQGGGAVVTRVRLPDVTASPSGLPLRQIIELPTSVTLTETFTARVVLWDDVVGATSAAEISPR